jgi:hypothetical protein
VSLERSHAPVSDARRRFLTLSGGRGNRPHKGVRT